MGEDIDKYKGFIKLDEFECQYTIWENEEFGSRYFIIDLSWLGNGAGLSQRYSLDTDYQYIMEDMTLQLKGEYEKFKDNKLKNAIV
jgi:hypothetical protein